jgi:hypothetical protein
LHHKNDLEWAQNIYLCTKKCGLFNHNNLLGWHVCEVADTNIHLPRLQRLQPILSSPVCCENIPSATPCV